MGQALHGSAFSLAEAFSIGLKSDEWGGRKSSRALRSSIAVRAAALLWAGRWSRITTSPGFQRRNEHLGDPGCEPRPGHRAIDHERGGHARQPQAPDEGNCLPVAVRHGHAQPLSTRGTSVAARHLRVGTGFVDEDQLFRVEVELAVEPGLAGAQDVGAILFLRMAGLFLRICPWRAKNRHSVDTATAIPSSASATRNSARVISNAASYSAQIRTALASVAAERVSPPCGLAAGFP